MFKLLKDLVNKSSLENKSELLAEIAKLEASNLVSMPSNLDTLLKDAKFSGLKSEIDKLTGSLRTKWDEEQKAKEEDALKKKEEEEKLKASKADKDTELSDFQKTVLEQFQTINSKFTELESNKKVTDLRSYANEKAKDIPEKLRNLINITAETTQEQIDEQIASINEVVTNEMKGIDEKPSVGTIVAPTDVEFERLMAEKEAEIN